MNRKETATLQSKIFIGAVLLLAALSTAAQDASKSPLRSFSRLVWSDEFNYKGLPDTNRWQYEKGYVRNREQQYYTDRRKQNAEVKKGHLFITVRNDSLQSDGDVRAITSASLTTKGRGEWTYGRIEVRAKFSSALGTWPAIWTLGSNIDTVGWPACGEIDMLEHVGYMPDTVHFNVHTKAYNHVIQTNKGEKVYSQAPHRKFHVYAIEWFPDRLDWYYDGKKVFSFANEGTGPDAWPFDKPQYLILNFAFGGAWGGIKGVNTKALPQQLVVDYVRVYQ